MFGLTQEAALYHKTGQLNGAPAYESDGIPFFCRIEPKLTYSIAGNTLGLTADTRIFAQGVQANAGDRIVVDHRSYIVKDVQEMRGLKSIHHLEIMAMLEDNPI